MLPGEVVDSLWFGDGRVLGMCKLILVFCLCSELNKMQEFV